MLLQIKEGGMIRFRRHTSHVYSLSSLLEEVNESVEHSLWNTVRAMDETLLLRHIAEHMDGTADPAIVARIEQQTQEVRQRTQLVRQALMQREAPGQEG